MLTNLTAAVQVVAQTTEEHGSLPMPAELYMLTIFGTLILLMLVTLCFMNTWHRHPVKEEHPDVYRQHTNKHDHGEAVPEAGKNPPVHH